MRDSRSLTGKVGGALVAEEEKKVIKRLNSTDANEEPKSIFNHASRGAEGSRWCVRSAIEVFRGKERERGITSRDRNRIRGKELSNVRKERAVARKPAKICWQAGLGCRLIGKSGRRVMGSDIRCCGEITSKKRREKTNV